jgi:hypothetical protein
VAFVVISPAMQMKPVLTSVSHATREPRVLREQRVEDRIGDLRRRSCPGGPR